MPSLPSPKPTVSCFDDLDFFKDFEKEFPAIVYNNAPTSKSDLLTEPTLNPQHIDEFDLKDETSFSEYVEEEQNILYFNDLLPFNIIQPNDLMSKKDNDDNEIDTIESSRDMAPLPPREQRHPFLRYHGLEYTDADIANFEERLERIHDNDTHRVQVVDFQGMPKLMRDVLDAKMLMEHRDDGGVVVFTIRSWRRLFDIRGPLVRGLILEFLSTLRFGEVLLDLDDPGPPPSYTLIKDSVLRLCHRMMAHSNAVRSQAPEKRFAARRKNWALIFGGQFVALLAEHFRLLIEERLRGLTEIDDTWAWVALGPERQPDAAVGASEAAEDAPVVDEGDQAVLAPVQAPPPPPTAAKTMPQRMARLEEDVYEIRGALAEQREVIGVMAKDFSKFTVWAANGIAQLLDSARVTYTPYAETHVPYKRRVRRKTDGASTSAAQQDQQQPDP
ncbi:hypothetical protein Tco_0458040 [Tanacetum coccineum]